MRGVSAQSMEHLACTICMELPSGTMNQWWVGSFFCVALGECGHCFVIVQRTRPPAMCWLSRNALQVWPTQFLQMVPPPRSCPANILPLSALWPTPFARSVSILTR